MSRGEKALRALLVSLAVGLGWGIRGDFGHLLGASYPGAALGLGFAFVTGQASMFRWMPIVGAAGGIGIALGGSMSYGILHGYAQSDTLLNYSYGFFTLVLEGGAWGAFGGVLIALLLEKPCLRASEWVSGLGTTILSGWLFYYVVHVLIGFDINPYRSNESLAFTGGVIGLSAWLVLKGRQYGLKGLLLGYVGFGLGMSLGRLLGNMSNSPHLILNHWNVMETSCGLIGGFIYTYGMLGPRFEAPPKTSLYKGLSILGILYVMAGIPLLHLLLRAKPEKVLETVKGVAGAIGVTDPAAYSEKVLFHLQMVCLLGIVGAAGWFYIHFKDRNRFAALPVLWFSGVMLLFQAVNCLYFLVPTGHLSVDMHTVFWVLYGLMIGFVVLWPWREVTSPDAIARSVNWKRWVGGLLASYVLIVIIASFVNGEQTMKTANTRWPIWAWKDGPFPGR